MWSLWLRWFKKDIAGLYHLDEVGAFDSRKTPEPSIFGQRMRFVLRYFMDSLIVFITSTDFMKFKILLLLLLGLYISCECERIDINPSDESNEVNIYDLEVGQKSLFQLMFQFPNGDGQMNYGEDTLVVEVLEQQGNRFVISEHITPESAMFDPVNGYSDSFLDTIVLNYWIVQDDGNDVYIEYEPLSFDGVASELLGFAVYDEQQTIRLATYDEKEIETTENDLSYVYEHYGPECFTRDLELNGEIYDSLNVVILRTQGIADDYETSWLFSEKHGIVRAFEFGDFTATGVYIGWQKIN